MEPETEHTIPAERPEEIRELGPGDPVFSLTAMIFLRCTTCDRFVVTGEHLVESGARRWVITYKAGAYSLRHDGRH